MRQRTATIVCAVALVVSVAIAAILGLRLMPVNGQLFGYDYNYYLPYLLAGDQWIRVNGWFTAPYFTAAFCGGLPWLANPESIFWSLPQLLFVILGPLGAVQGTFLLSLIFGASSTWLLVKRNLAASPEAATLGACLFALNGFLTYRMAIGHLTYHVIALVPVLAVLAVPVEGEVGRCDQTLSSLIRCIAGGLVVASFVYAGAANFVVPAVLSVAAVILVTQVRSRMRLQPFAVLIGASLVAIPLAAIKLVPSIALIVQFPRPYLAASLFSEPLKMVDVFLRALFVPEALPSSVQFGPGRRWLGRHEFEFGVSIVPALLCSGALIMRLRGRGSPWSVTVTAALGTVLILPILVTVGPDSWARFLGSIVILNSHSVLTRWWAVYLLPLIVAAALSLDLICHASRWRLVALATAVCLAIGQSIHRDDHYYRSGKIFPLYNAEGVAAAHRRLASGGTLPPITAVGPANVDSNRGSAAPMDGLMRGVSSLPCYEALFGYGSELMPPTGLVAGPITAVGNQLLNILDPRCFLGPADAACRPGQRLSISAYSEAKRFAEYRPISWQQPAWQIAARLATVGSLLFSLLVLAYAGTHSLCRAVRRSRASTPEQNCICGMPREMPLEIPDVAGEGHECVAEAHTLPSATNSPPGA